MLTIGFTGHRPNKLYGYDLSKKEYKDLGLKCEEVIKQIIDKNKNNTFKGIVGGALGFDTLMFETMLNMKNTEPLVIEMAIPFEQQMVKWPKEAQDTYMSHKQYADIVTYVDTLDTYKVPNTIEGRYNSKKLFKRNEYIADNSDILIACIRDMKSGSGHCANYFKKVHPNNKVIIINPDTLEVFEL